MSKAAKLRRIAREEAAFILAGIVCTGLLYGSRPLHATVESVCVGVTVIGLNGGDPGVAFCNPPVIVASSSSSSSSAASSTSSSAASAQSSAQSSSDSGGGGDSGGYRHHPSRVVELIEQWRLRRTVRPAAPEKPCIHYTDVRTRSWYAEAVCDFLNAEYLDSNLPLFYPHKNALRAEMAKLLTVMHGGTMYVPDEPSFNDAFHSAWYYSAVETAARRGWMIGYGDCYGTKPCYTHPTAEISRAEAAALAVRFFAYTPLYVAPLGTDLQPDGWYRDELQIAADHCIMLGDEGRTTMRPNDPVTRAEMVVMLWRGQHNLRYGIDCTSGAGTHSGDTNILSTFYSMDDAQVASMQMAEEFFCMQSVMGCLSQAVMADAGAVSSEVMKQLFPASSQRYRTPLTEPILWGIGAIWFYILSRIALKTMHAGFSHRRSI